MNVPITELLIIVLLTLLEGFFVAAEIALVSIRRSRVDQLVEEERPGARRVRRLLDEPGRFLAVSQLGLTVIGFFASAFAAVNLANQLTGLLTGFGLAAGTAEGLSLVIVTVLLALFTIVFAELVPKTLALAHAERYAFALSLPIEVPGPRAVTGDRRADRGDQLDRRPAGREGLGRGPDHAPRSCA